MFIYEKSLQYPVKIKNPNPSLAKFIISQYGGPDGFRDKDGRPLFVLDFQDIFGFVIHDFVD